MKAGYTRRLWANVKASYRISIARSWATAEIARDADDVNFKHSRSLKIIRCCANRRGIGLYDFLPFLRYHA